MRGETLERGGGGHGNGEEALTRKISKPLKGEARGGFFAGGINKGRTTGVGRGAQGGLAIGSGSGNVYPEASLCLEGCWEGAVC